MHIRRLREQGFEAKAIRTTYPDKTRAWAFCRRFAVGSTSERRVFSCGASCRTAVVCVAADGGHFEQSV